MGEVSHVKAGVPKPRPLGLVKRESIHFEDVESNTSSSQLSELPGGGDLPSSFYFQGRSKTDVDLRQDLKSMRDLQETLRQAALLNIVAAVNNESRPPDTMPSTSRTVGHQAPGLKGANVLGHSLPAPENSKLVLSHGSTAHPGGAFSRHLHTAASNAPPTPAAPPNTALSQLLSQRPRAISIPRPRTHGEQSTFMHSSLPDAKEQLANMTNFRGARSKHDYSDPLQAALSNTSSGVTSVESKTADKQDGRNTSTGLHTLQTGDVTVRTGDFSTTPYALRGTGLETGHHTAEGVVLQGKSATQDDNGPHNSQTDQNGNAGKLSKDEQRAHNVHQMQMLKRHISTTKKRELVKKLTEIAKCEAVDMNEAMEAESSGPMIIMAQNKSRYRVDLESPELPNSASFMKRTKSTSSLQEKLEGSRVPSNTRVQSETLESMLNYRESKRTPANNPDEDLVIEGVNYPEGGANDFNARVSETQSENYFPHEMYQYPDLNIMWARDQRLNGYANRQNPYSATPEVLELRPLATSPVQLNKNGSNDKRKIIVSRRGGNPVLRDKLVSPSPVVYEASYHRPKASIGHISLVGQSLPSLPVSRPSPLNHKPSSRRQTQDESRAPSQAQNKRPTHEEEPQPMRLWNDGCDRPLRQVLKPWGSTARQTTSDSPILKTEILDHLQCVGIVNRRPTINSQRRSISKVIGSNKVPNEGDDESLDDFLDDDEPEMMKSSSYRRSKLYSAFRASEENLANLAEVSSLVSETLTARSLLNQPVWSKEPSLPPPPPSRDPVQQSQSEPRYMGCSSRVSDNEMRSQFHFLNDREEAEAKQGGNFRVLKALDQDVYFDFQHKKYRNNNTSSTLNTAANKPRMHFIKIKYSGEAKS